MNTDLDTSAIRASYAEQVCGQGCYGDIEDLCNEVDRLRGPAHAYWEAVAALSEVTGGGPLSTTIGFLIRDQWLIPNPEKAGVQ